MKRIIASVPVAIFVMAILVATSVAAFADPPCQSEGVGAIDASACVSEDGDVSAAGDAGAVDAEGDASGGSGGATVDAGAADVQGGTDRQECADAGSINVPSEQKDCPPQ